MKFSVILAATKEGGIGKDNAIPWKLKPDMAYFRAVTTSRDDPLHRKNAIVMGRKTWESIPPKFRPLPNRINVIVSSNQDLLEGNVNPDAFVVSSLGEALSVLEKREDCARVFIGGGARLYTEALARPGALTAAVNWYRAALRFPPRVGGRKWPEGLETLVVWGERDRYLGPGLLEALDRWVPDLTVERIPDASHWVQADAPARVNDLLVTFLKGVRPARSR